MVLRWSGARPAGAGIASAGAGELLITRLFMPLWPNAVLAAVPIASVATSAAMAK